MYDQRHTHFKANSTLKNKPKWNEQVTTLVYFNNIQIEGKCWKTCLIQGKTNDTVQQCAEKHQIKKFTLDEALEISELKFQKLDKTNKQPRLNTK